MCLRIDVFRRYNESNHVSILREATGSNVTYDHTSVRGGNLTEAPLIYGNVSWCPDDTGLTLLPKLQVDLGMPFNISKVEVQGAKDAKEWPYKFCLSYSLNQGQFTEARTQESSCLVRHLFFLL
ncbi:uncharacterized protein LOC110059049 [Orbicella faveolata]|uniref:uncharacterized protein LOC110059049 n=1 Tax=Orbicella faveolata TaxID=48498 RepID=UPI0009E56782|nr:uncharacterized protein LOC110059049 [Orbicella faveolata]